MMGGAATRRSALVTGSSAGLGYAVAESLAAAGHDIVLHGLDSAEAVEPARAALQARHGTAVAYCKADLSELAGIERLMAVAREAAAVRTSWSITPWCVTSRRSSSFPPPTGSVRWPSI